MGQGEAGGSDGQRGQPQDANHHHDPGRTHRGLFPAGTCGDVVSQWRQQLCQRTQDPHHSGLRQETDTLLGKLSDGIPPPHQSQNSGGRGSFAALEIRNFTHKVFEEAIVMGYAERNPLAHVHLPRDKQPQKEQPWLNTKQTADLLRVLANPEFEAKCQERYGEHNAPVYEMVYLSFATGVHYSEMAGLQWKNLNLTNEAVFVDNQKLERYTVRVARGYVGRKRHDWLDGPRGEFGQPKNKRRYRKDPLIEDAVPILLALHARSKFTSPMIWSSAAQW